jgi:hypothetical protein
MLLDWIQIKDKKRVNIPNRGGIDIDLRRADRNGIARSLSLLNPTQMKLMKVHCDIERVLNQEIKHDEKL